MTPPRPIDVLVCGTTALVVAFEFTCFPMWNALPMMLVAAYMLTRWASARRPPG